MEHKKCVKCYKVHSSDAIFSKLIFLSSVEFFRFSVGKQKHFKISYSTS